MTTTQEQRPYPVSEDTKLAYRCAQLRVALDAAEAERDRLQEELDGLVNIAAALKATEASWKRDCIAAWEALATAESEARRYAEAYPQGSDGRNTFVILADRIAALGDTHD